MNAKENFTDEDVKIMIRCLGDDPLLGLEKILWRLADGRKSKAMLIIAQLWKHYTNKPLPVSFETCFDVAMGEANNGIEVEWMEEPKPTVLKKYKKDNTPWYESWLYCDDPEYFDRLKEVGFIENELDGKKIFEVKNDPNNPPLKLARNKELVTRNVGS